MEKLKCVSKHTEVPYVHSQGMNFFAENTEDILAIIIGCSVAGAVLFVASISAVYIIIKR